MGEGGIYLNADIWGLSKNRIRTGSQNGFRETEKTKKKTTQKGHPKKRHPVKSNKRQFTILSGMRQIGDLDPNMVVFLQPSVALSNQGDNGNPRTT